MNRPASSLLPWEEGCQASFQPSWRLRFSFDADNVRLTNVCIIIIIIYSLMLTVTEWEMLPESNQFAVFGFRWATSTDNRKPQCLARNSGRHRRAIACDEDRDGLYGRFAAWQWSQARLDLSPVISTIDSHLPGVERGFCHTLCLSVCLYACFFLIPSVL